MGVAKCLIIRYLRLGPLSNLRKAFYKICYICADDHRREPFKRGDRAGRPTAFCAGGRQDCDGAFFWPVTRVVDTGAVGLQTFCKHIAVTKEESQRIKPLILLSGAG